MARGGRGQAGRDPGPWWRCQWPSVRLPSTVCVCLATLCIHVHLYGMAWRPVAVCVCAPRRVFVHRHIHMDECVPLAVVCLCCRAHCGTRASNSDALPVGNLNAHAMRYTLGNGERAAHSTDCMCGHTARMRRHGALQCSTTCTQLQAAALHHSHRQCAYHWRQTLSGHWQAAAPTPSLTGSSGSLRRGHGRASGGGRVSRAASGASGASGGGGTPAKQRREQFLCAEHFVATVSAPESSHALGPHAPCERRSQ